MVALVSACVAVEGGEARGSNVALGRKVAVYPIPKGATQESYQKLTDGKYAEGILWESPESVSWRTTNNRSITIDFGDIVPVAGVALSTAVGARLEFGTEGKVLPGFIDLFVSNDNSQWHHVGELGELHELEHGPLRGIEGEAFRREVIKASLATHGRYLKLAFTGHANLSIDEIEVYAGEKALLDVPLQPPGLGSSALYQYIEEQDRTARLLRRQYRHDIAQIRGKLRSLPAASAEAINEELDALQRQIPEATTVPHNRRVTLPVGDFGEKILQQLAAVYRAQKLPEILLWTSDHWEFLDWMGEPEKEGSPSSVTLSMLQGEWRSASFNLTNSTDRRQEFTISFSGLPGGALPEYISVHPVLWTTNPWREASATALGVPERTSSGVKISIPSGGTQQVWLSIQAPAQAGMLEGEIRIEPSEATLASHTLPVRLSVSALKMPEKQSLHLGGWDYAESFSYGVHAGNIKPLVETLRRYTVDSPWGWRGNMPFGTFSANNDYATERDEPSTKRFDRWVQEVWPGAYRYHCYIEVHGRKGPSNFPGLDSKGDKAQFEARVATWLRFWEAHVIKLGLKPEQICLQITDEIGGNPNNAFFKDEILRAWTEAIKKAGVGFKLWLNPIYDEPWNADQEALRATDILCGKYNRFLDNGERFRAFWANELAAGRELAFYECRSSPPELYDPYSYFRLQAWLAWKYGARSIFFWSLSDNGTLPGNSFDPGRKRYGYSPLFLDQTESVLPTKQLEAIREGVQDYEYLAMLREAIARNKGEAALADTIQKAEHLLETAVERVFRMEDIQKQPRWLWKKEFSRSEADDVRAEILALLESLATRK